MRSLRTAAMTAETSNHRSTQDAPNLKMIDDANDRDLTRDPLALKKNCCKDEGACLSLLCLIGMETYRQTHLAAAMNCSFQRPMTATGANIDNGSNYRFVLHRLSMQQAKCAVRRMGAVDGLGQRHNIALDELPIAVDGAHAGLDNSLKVVADEAPVAVGRSTVGPA